MAYLSFIVLTAALVVGWVVLVGYESRRGIRFAAMQRASLDARIERIEFILAHVDFVAFVREESRQFISRTGHDVVELSLRAVRTIERFLTRSIRLIRERNSRDMQPNGNARTFIKQLSEFKEQLQSQSTDSP